MMEKIREIQTYSGIGFERLRDNKIVQLVSVDSFKKKVDEFMYLLLVDSYGYLIKEAYNYLNITLRVESLKKREQTLIALKLLYSFIDLFGLSGVEDINKDNVSKLNEFLEGGVREGNGFVFIGITIRSNSTINKYFSVYRSYFNFLEVNDSIFNEIKELRYIKDTSTGFFAHTVLTESFLYDVTKVDKVFNNVPKYISLVEYRDIINIIKANYSEREEIFVILMYEYGMRIGEVLGLTIEDVLGTKYTKDNYGILVLRNRYTDKSYQNAKGCMKVTSRDIYNKPDYHAVGLGKHFGCELVKVSLETLQKIENYIKTTRQPNNWGFKAYSNLKKQNIADKVTDRIDIKRNSYIFVSKNGTPICCKAWDNVLKEIYARVNIKIDTHKKKEGLSHRFRHGFAMFKVLVEKYSRLELKNALRHRNIRSCEYYFSLTDVQKSELVHNAFTLQKEGGMDI